MKDAVIENPILNNPFEEPTRHFKFTDEGITNQIVEGRRISSYFIPIPKAKRRKAEQLTIQFNEWTEDRVKENEFINKVREQVGRWRKGGYLYTTAITRRLLEYWQDPEREKKLFFCQIEALETAIYLTEVAQKIGNSWIENELRGFNLDANPLLNRIAFKMATGTGKTVVMAMLISWQALNKLHNKQDSRFSDTFLLVTPGITIRDRLRVLLPNDPGNYYKQRDILPADWLKELEQAKILITNFHAFLHKDRSDAASLTKKLLTPEGKNPLLETPDQMVRRVCRELGNKKNIIVINDEAHHCYRRRPEPLEEFEEEKLKGDEAKEAKKRDEEARIWISGLEAIKQKIGIRAVYDLSATPFFLKGSGYPEGTLFPWVVSDFSLIDAIESGLVKIPRVPVDDNQGNSDLPTYRNLWVKIKDSLPKKGRGTEAVSGEPKLPVELQGAIHSLYGNYEKAYRQWEKQEEGTPPVFIVVCNNTNVSKLVYDYISGWEKKLSDGETVVVPGALKIFNNEENGRWMERPNTLLIDSEQLENGEAMSDEFKKMVRTEIEEFKQEYRIRYPGRDTDKLTDEDLLREVMNTVGKQGKLGENIKCVVSVSMLTEGWDANTVTHILGVRAFGTQLLCEQVIGRGLRRVSYVQNDEGFFDPEYAEVYGVPFSFIPCSGGKPDPEPRIFPTRVRAMADRSELEITFPRVTGYRYKFPEERLEANFTEESRLVLSTADIPTEVQCDPIVGESSIHTLDALKQRRMQEVAFFIAKKLLEEKFRDEENSVKPWLFPGLLRITRQWLEESVVCKDDTFPQMILMIEFAYSAVERIYSAIVETIKGEKRLMPVLRPYDTVGSTRYVDFDTTKPVYETREDKCHISHVVNDTKSWEQKLAQTLEDMDEVICYVKNQGLQFTIPYTINGEEKQYLPDFIVKFNDGQSEPLNLILEVTGEKRKDKAEKVRTAKTLWVPAVNNYEEFGRWVFLEITDPWDAKNLIRQTFGSNIEKEDLSCSVK